MRDIKFRTPFYSVEHQQKTGQVMYAWSVFFHLLFVTFWLGGMLFTVSVLVPATRKKLAAKKGLLFTELGTRFSRLSWVAFPFLFLTGTTALIGKGFTPGYLFSGDFWHSVYGERLAGKLILFGMVLLVSGIHDFWLGPKAAEQMDSDPESPVTARYRRASRWGGRINLILGLAILYQAVQLVR